MTPFIMKYVLTTLFWIAGMFNVIVAIVSHKKESIYVKKLLKKNAELEETIIQLNNDLRESKRTA